MAEGQAPTFPDELAFLQQIDDTTPAENIDVVGKASNGSKGSNSANGEDLPLHEQIHHEGFAHGVGFDGVGEAGAERWNEGPGIYRQRTPTIAPTPTCAYDGAQASASAAASPPPPSPAQEQDSNVDVVAEARRLGLDSDFLAALPREMALELLDEKRRENELLYDNDSRDESAFSTLPTAGPNPAMDEYSAPSVPSSFDQRQRPFGQEDIMSISDIMRGASSTSYSHSMPSTSYRPQGQQVSSASSPFDFALPSPSTTRIANNNNPRRGRRMMRGAIQNLVQRNDQSESEWGALHGLSRTRNGF